MLSRLQDGTAPAAKNVEPPSPYRKAEVKLSFFNMVSTHGILREVQLKKNQGRNLFPCRRCEPALLHGQL